MSTKSTIPSLLKIKDYVTLIGTTIGIIALICGSFGTRDAVSLGFFLISITLGTDLIDGYIARKTGTVNDMGKELDSLSDSLTFGIAPAILSFQAFKTLGFFYTNYFHAFANGGLTYPFLAITYYIVPFLLIFIGWLNITTYIKFGEKGKIVYYVFILLAPISPIFGLIGILNPNYIVSMTAAIIFLILFIILLSWTVFHSFLLDLLAKGKDKKSD